MGCRGQAGLLLLRFEFVAEAIIDQASIHWLLGFVAWFSLRVRDKYKSTLKSISKRIANNNARNSGTFASFEEFFSEDNEIWN